MAGLLQAGRGARADQGAARGGRPADPLPHPRHVGHAGRDRARGRRAGVDAVDAAMDALSGITSQPSLGSIVEALRGTDARPRARPRVRSAASRSTGRRCATSTPPSRATSRARRSEVYLHEMPGGQYTNLKEQAALARPRDPLARGRADLCRRQPDVRRHRQGDAVLQGRRRHGADDGQPGPHRGRRR